MIWMCSSTFVLHDWLRSQGARDTHLAVNICQYSNPDKIRPLDSTVLPVNALCWCFVAMFGLGDRLVSRRSLHYDTYTMANSLHNSPPHEKGDFSVEESHVANRQTACSAG